jgi:8-oxo-dGTP pyrophosphatase MutT (NUDIX family)
VTGGAVTRRIRRAARIVVLDPHDRVLLFRYVPADYPLFWILPGGACDPGEDFAACARRELFEETGIVADPLPLDLVREAEYEYLGEPVKSVEHFFQHRVGKVRIDTSGHTELERAVMQEHRWFTRAELIGWPETVYPLDLSELVVRIAACKEGCTP